MARNRHHYRWVVIGIAFELGLAGLAWLLGWPFQILPLAHFSWDWPDIIWGIAASLPLFLVFLLLLRQTAGPLAQTKLVLEETVRPIFAHCTLPELAAISLSAGIGEEMLFRGVIQELFSRPWVGVLVASAIFGMFHPLSATYVLIAALFGVYLGVCLIASGNLLLVVVAHGLYDFLALAYLVRFHVPRPAAQVNEEALPDDDLQASGEC
jgi:uncharacterized protein